MQNKNIQPFIIPFLLIAFFLTVSSYNFLLFHSLAELTSVCVMWTLFLLIWNSRGENTESAIVFIAVAYLFIAFIDLMHTLAYKGMGILEISSIANPATQLWIAARYMESFSLLLFPFLIKRKI